MRGRPSSRRFRGQAKSQPLQCIRFGLKHQKEAGVLKPSIWSEKNYGYKQKTRKSNGDLSSEAIVGGDERFGQDWGKKTTRDARKSLGDGATHRDS